MKLRTEISSHLSADEEEIVISCKERSSKIMLLESLIENVINEEAELVLTLQDAEYYVPKKSVLFFETYDGRVTAHTADAMYYTEYKLYELEKIMPSFFVRVSKSCILNTLAVSSIRRNLAGASEVYFKGSTKKVYASRSYYKQLKDRIYEMRF